MSKEINDFKQQIMWLQNQNALLINRQEALRDHFAGLAMQALTAPQDNGYDFIYNAEMAYEQADAMITERNKYKERHETFGEEV